MLYYECRQVARMTEKVVGSFLLLFTSFYSFELALVIIGLVLLVELAKFGLTWYKCKLVMYHRKTLLIKRQEDTEKVARYTQELETLLNN